MSVIQIAQRNKESGDKNPTRHYSKKQENYVAKKFEGKRQCNSGATQFHKGDVVLDKVLIECKTKTTSSESISIKKEWIEKNNREALFEGKAYSAIAFNFGPNEQNHYIISEEMFELLLEKLNEIES